MHFVPDANLPVSGLVAAGLPRRLVDGAKAGESGLCTSEVLQAELVDVLSRSKFAARLGQAGPSWFPTRSHVRLWLSPLRVTVSSRSLGLFISTPLETISCASHPRAEFGARAWMQTIPLVRRAVLYLS